MADSRDKSDWNHKNKNSKRNRREKDVCNHENGNQKDETRIAVPNDKLHRPKVVQPISQPTLARILQMRGDVEIIWELSSEQKGFLLLLDQPNISIDSMLLILSALARVSESSSEQDTAQLLVYFFMKIVPKLNSKANFYREIKLYIANLGTNTAEQSQRGKHVEAVQNLLVFLHRLQGTVRHKSSDAVRDLMELITVQIEFINRKSDSLSESFVELLTKVSESAESLKQVQIKAKKDEVLMEPPDDFRAISIYPDAFDILNDRVPFIRENVVEGKYEAGIDHYLDVQFRLLREDFIRSLREGVNEYRQLQNTPGASTSAKMHAKDLNIYQNVRIFGSKMLHIDHVHLCEFDSTPFRNMRWEVSISSDLCFERQLFSYILVGTS